MARRKRKKIAIGRKECIFITLIVVILGLILLVVNRKTIKEPEYSVQFHEKEVEIYIGEQLRVGYTITNSKGKDKLSWTTSNSNVATVDSRGMITGISFGDVIIIVQLPNGSSSSLKLRVKSYPVYLRLKTSNESIKGWYNQETKVFIDSLNIENIKYCVSKSDDCYPVTNYKDKIVLKDGIWNLYITGLDKNGKTITHHENFRVDLIAPVCNITRVGKLVEATATIEIICDKDASGVDKYEWYRDGKRVYMTYDGLIHTSEIYADGKHKYSVKVYDLAGNSATYSIDN